MNYYEDLLSRLRFLNPGTRNILSTFLNREKVLFLQNLIELLKKINEKEDEVKNLTRDQMLKKVEEIKKLISKGEPIDNFIVDTFSLVREAARRTLNMRHFDVQIIGGIVLHLGKIAEMATGEGKTLVATLPLFLNALKGEGCHLVTVNDYLAKRDTQWMGPIYDYLGLSVGCIVSYRETKDRYSSVAYKFDPTHLPPDSRFLYLRPVSRKEAYLCDITYGTGSEFGFDYLRDNMAVRKEDQVQRNLNYAIIDEVDSILIDEARTPLIISGPSEESPSLYYEVDRLVRKLSKDKDFVVDEENQTVTLTEEGIKKCEKLLNISNLYDGTHTELVHHINQALRAHNFFKRDKEYVVKDGQVIIVDEFTGRLMPGRRWSDGLHQAIEAKEGVRIESENQTLATISFQNYFKLYKKIAGMTGTAITEALEFKEIYKLDVIVIPTNKPLKRTEYDDEIYTTEKEKFNAIIKEIEELYKIGRPVLVGTISIEKAEKLSKMLDRKNIPHKVLHGKNHEAEAAIIAQAGKPKAVTIATQMAGRGVDIILGGNPEIIAREETVKILWQKKRTKRDLKIDFIDIINEIDEKYRKRQEEIEKTLGTEIKKFKETISEIEKILYQKEKAVKETVEKEIFEKKSNGLFKKYEGKLLKLKTIYETNNNKLEELNIQFKDKPEKTKEIREIAGKSFREYINYKNYLKKIFNIKTREDIEGKRNSLFENLENQKDKKELTNICFPIIEELKETCLSYLKTLEEIYSEILFTEQAEKSKKKINRYIEFLENLKNSMEKLENEEFFSNFKDREYSFYKNLEEGFAEIEKEIYKKYCPDYIEIEKEYEKTIREYEKVQKKYTEQLNLAREEYEKERSQYEEEWKKIREDMEKSPEEFKEIYKELLEKYKKPWEEDHKKVVELGGLHIIGSERYEARRIDNQLKGRAGRQGDPGSSKFFLSLEDDLLRIFGGERLKGIMGKLPEGEKITHPLITKMINNAQKKVEGRNFEIRKNLLEFDNVLNEQRNIIYTLRQNILENKNLDEYLKEYIEEIVETSFDEYCDEKIKPYMWKVDGMIKYFKTTFGINIEIENLENIKDYLLWRENFKEKVKESFFSILQEKKNQLGDFFEELKKFVFLQVIDNKWKAHLRAMDELREGISLRAYAQKDPLIAYKHESFQYFQEMLKSIKEEIIGNLLKIQITEKVALKVRQTEKKEFVHQTYEQFAISKGEEREVVPVAQRQSDNLYEKKESNNSSILIKKEKIGRNQPCPCGSGKKYKHCCGKNE
ncbi:MAG: SEC-C metal-binding domain-containing protein [Candidatus Omnitrophica bacterium]|nr:SEC-C metal-binding domain-containing protein [Candidatus Omnitrophota bacterium]